MVVSATDQRPQASWTPVGGVGVASAASSPNGSSPDGSSGGSSTATGSGGGSGAGGGSVGGTANGAGGVESSNGGGGGGSGGERRGTGSSPELEERTAGGPAELPTPSRRTASDPHNNGARAALTNEIRNEFFRLYQRADFQIPGLSPQNILRHKDKDLYFEGHDGLRDFWKQTAASRREILQLARENKIRVNRGPPPHNTFSSQSSGEDRSQSVSTSDDQGTGSGSGTSSVAPSISVDSRKRNHHADILTDPPTNKRQQQSLTSTANGYIASTALFSTQHILQPTPPSSLVGEQAFWADRSMPPSHQEQQQRQQLIQQQSQPHQMPHQQLHQRQSPASPPLTHQAPSNPTAIATLLADLQAAFQEYDINLPSNHSLVKLKDERDRAMERALRMERERDEAFRSRDAALKIAEESYGELRALMDSRARRIQEIRDDRATSLRTSVAQEREKGDRDHERDRDRGGMMANGGGAGNGEWE